MPPRLRGHSKWSIKLGSSVNEITLETAPGPGINDVCAFQAWILDENYGWSSSYISQYICRPSSNFPYCEKSFVGEAVCRTSVGEFFLDAGINCMVLWRISKKLEAGF